MEEVGTGPGSNGQLLNEAAADKLGSTNVQHTGAPTMEHVAADPGSERMVQQLRNSWHCAAVTLFCRGLGSRLGIKPFTADLFEHRLLAPREQAGSFWDDLVPKLLSRYAAAQQC
jgi:hypothetical protein